jgi:hypothetical protein
MTTTVTQYSGNVFFELPAVALVPQDLFKYPSGFTPLRAVNDEGLDPNGSRYAIDNIPAWLIPEFFQYVVQL